MFSIGVGTCRCVATAAGSAGSDLDLPDSGQNSITRSCDALPGVYVAYARGGKFSSVFGFKMSHAAAPRLTCLESFVDDKLDSFTRVLLWPLTEREELRLELFMSDVRPGGPFRHTSI